MVLVGLMLLSLLLCICLGCIFIWGEYLLLCVCGSVTFCGMQLVCWLHARYCACFRYGIISIDARGCVSLCVCALYMACSSAFVSLLG